VQQGSVKNEQDKVSTPLLCSKIRLKMNKDKVSTHYYAKLHLKNSILPLKDASEKLLCDLFYSGHKVTCHGLPKSKQVRGL